MKKFISFLSAAVLSVTAIAPQIVSAATTTADTSPYTLRFVPDRNFVTAEEVAEGDVTIHAAVYISGSTANTIGAATVKYDSDSSNVYFTNMKSGGTSLDSSETVSYSGGSFTTSKVPFCFGTVKDGKYSTASSVITTREYAVDPIYGANLESDGNGSVTFTSTPSYPASLLSGIDTLENGTISWNVDNSKATVTYVCPVTVDAEGNGTYSYEYIERDSGQVKTATATLPRYNANLAAGEKIPDKCNTFVWVPANIDQLENGASFLGYSSDEFSLFQVDIVIAKDTPCGIYNINFNTSVESTTGAQCQLTNASKQNLALSYQGTSIAVGVDSAVVTAATQNPEEAAFYTADDTHKVYASDFMTQVLADVTYTEIDPSTGEQKVESNVDITNLLDFDGYSPSEMFSYTDAGICYSNIDAPLFFNGEIISWNDAGCGMYLTTDLEVAQKGDVNLDGVVNASDAYEVLVYYAAASVGSNPTLYQGSGTASENLEKFLFFLADVDTCSKTGSTSTAVLDTDDAYDILLYYASQAVGETLSWNSLRK